MFVKVVIFSDDPVVIRCPVEDPVNMYFCWSFNEPVVGTGRDEGRLGNRYPLCCVSCKIQLLLFQKIFLSFCFFVECSIYWVWYIMPQQWENFQNVTNLDDGHEWVRRHLPNRLLIGGQNFSIISRRRSGVLKWWTGYLRCYNRFYLTFSFSFCYWKTKYQATILRQEKL